MERLIIYGLGDFALHCAHLFEESKKYKVVAFIADEAFIKKSYLGDKPVYAFETVEHKFPPEYFKMFVAVGYSKMRNRQLMYSKAKKKGFELASYYSSTAILNKEVFGDNNLILDLVVIEPRAKIGSNNIIWTSAIICHDSIVGDSCFIAAKTIVGGNSKVNNNCFLGFNSVVLQNSIVDTETLIGSCSMVNGVTKPFSKMYGVPARSMGNHSKHGIMIK